MKTSAMVMFAAAFLISTVPVASAATCKYRMVDTFTGGTFLITGWGAAFKQQTACNRAKSACLRKLRKYWKKHPKAMGLACKRD